MGEIVKPSRIDFDNMDLNQIQRIYSSGSLSELTAAEQVYYSLMEKVRGLRARMKFNDKLVTKAGIIRNLKEADGLTDYQARRVYADALNFFYDTEEVRPKAWANLYAEKCENFANMLFTMGKPKEALRYLKMAASRIRTTRSPRSCWTSRLLSSILPSRQTWEHRILTVSASRSS